MIELRAYQPGDLDALYQISLATGHIGGDASHLYQDPRLMGHIYVAPYVALNPDQAIVAVDAEGVAGYAVGVADTKSWEARLEREWWIGLRKLYQSPDPADRPHWTPDQRRIDMIFSPQRSPTPVVRTYPAHLHVNLLPRVQRRHVGSQLFQAWLEVTMMQGVTAMHVGVNRANMGAQHFWHAQGFREIPLDSPSERTVWMGRHA